MSEMDNARIVREALSAYQRGDLQTVLTYFSDDIELQVSLPRDVVPWGGERRGKTELVECFAGLAEIRQREQFEPREFIAQGDEVAVVGFERWRIKATGHTIDNNWVMIFTVKNGTITRIRVFEDTAKIVAALRGSEGRC
jgi:uncharacterized protein